MDVPANPVLARLRWRHRLTVLRRGRRVHHGGGRKSSQHSRRRCASPESCCTTHNSLSHCLPTSLMGCMYATAPRARKAWSLRAGTSTAIAWAVAHTHDQGHHVTGEALARALGIVVGVRISQKGCEFADTPINIVVATASIIL